ncbi:MAG: tetratricopeptide repeat protein [Candidatus Andersenbacteria bacterium]|nr:tetratricopeptide repeat protein [Candidatus Andersenbacteria bacterium]
MNNFGERYISWGAPVLIVAVVIGVYGATMNAPFVFDDLGAIANNADLHRFDFKRLDNYFGVRALPHLTLALNWRWGGDKTFWYHMVNVGVHALASLVVWRIGLLLAQQHYAVRSGAVWIGLGAGLLFAVHPLQTEAVTYVTQRITSLAAMFYLIALWAYAEWRAATIPPNPPLSQPSHKATAGTARRAHIPIIWAAISLVAALAAMNSKEIAFTLPLAIVWLEWCFFVRKSAGRTVLWLSPWLLLLLYIPWLRLGSMGAVPPAPLISPTAQLITAEDVPAPAITNSPLWQPVPLPRTSYVFTQLSLLLGYLRLVVWPAGQNIDHDAAVYDTLLAWRPIAGLAAVGLLAGACLWLRRRRPLLAFGIGFFLLTWAPEAVYPLVELMVEYRLYLPMAGLALAAAELLVLSWQRFKPFRPAFLGAAATVIVLLGLSAHSRNALWRDPVRLWQDAIAKSPAKARPAHNLGSIYLEREQYELAEYYLKKAAALDPRQAVTQANLGTALLNRGALDEAEDHYQKAKQLQPQMAALATPLAQLYIQQGRWEEAQDLLEDIVRRDPRRAEAFNSLGIVYARRGEAAKARQQFEAALAIEPNYKSAQHNLETIAATAR